MRIFRSVWVVLLSGCVLAWGQGCRPAAPPAKGGLSAIEALSQVPESTGFARALTPRPFRFPDDDGPHPAFQTEWWYYTGNLQTAGPSPRDFGYQLTFFRRALAPSQTATSPDWTAQQLYFAHFTLSDIAAGAFYPFERWSRGAIGLAGAQTTPHRVWLDDWQVSGDPTRSLQLHAQAEAVSLTLNLTPVKAPVLQGNAGLSQKSGGVGNASYYYSRPRLRSQGEVRIGEQRWPVRGDSWLDREWSTSVLSKEQAGWDWFSLQLADGRELMLYQLRTRSGGIDSHSAGSLMAADGSSQTLKATDFTITPTDTWTSPRSGIRYPSGWRVTVPQAALSLTVTPRLRDQELPLALTYWEGAVQVAGSQAGRGYVELTGYTRAEAAQ
ncbi:MAG: lipocalin-like domain-containing protein [Candidatus Sericytochromatia bacterium]